MNSEFEHERVVEIVLVPSALRALLFERARTRAPREACGFLVGVPALRGASDASSTRDSDRSRGVEGAEHASEGNFAGARGVVEVVDVVEVPNVSESPEHEFRIDPAVCVAEHDRARARGLALVGTWHSHPGGDVLPSSRDRSAAFAGDVFLGDGVASGGIVLVVALSPAPDARPRLGAWRAFDGGFAELRVVTRASCAARVSAHNLGPETRTSNETNP